MRLDEFLEDLDAREEVTVGEHDDYEVVVDTGNLGDYQLKSNVKGVRWEHQDKAVVIELE